MSMTVATDGVRAFAGAKSGARSVVKAGQWVP